MHSKVPTSVIVPFVEENHANLYVWNVHVYYLANFNIISNIKILSAMKYAGLILDRCLTWYAHIIKDKWKS